MALKTPDWVKNAVFYQIFPDRFQRSGRAKLPAHIKLKPWGTPPQEQGFQGGDLYGIADRLDYLTELGINALYLNPIFASAANHRYHTFDYYQVDPLLGGNEALRELLERAHAKNIRVVLDGVFNHASRGFWAFHHILENGADSPYIDWFIIRDWPLRPYSSDHNNPPNYDAWWSLPALPKFNFHNPDVQDYFLDVAKYWIDFGADGWRLDVPEEIDHERFWQRFRKVVKTANPESYICGEIWHIAPQWLTGDRFDALMNYPLGTAAIGFFGGEKMRTDYQQGDFVLKRLDAQGLAGELRNLLRVYSWEAICAQLNLFDSHDTARILWLLGEDKSALRLCLYFQMTLPGAPCIYYGSEIGMSAGHEPLSRAAFPWKESESWDMTLRNIYRETIQLRHRCPALRTGSLIFLEAYGKILAYIRQLEEQTILVVFNADISEEKIILDMPANLKTPGQWEPLLDEAPSIHIDQDRFDLILSPYSVAIYQFITLDS